MCFLDARTTPNDEVTDRRGELPVMAPSEPTSEARRPAAVRWTGWFGSLVAPVVSQSVAKHLQDLSPGADSPIRPRTSQDPQSLLDLSDAPLTEILPEGIVKGVSEAVPLGTEAVSDRAWRRLCCLGSVQFRL